MTSSPIKSYAWVAAPGDTILNAGGKGKVYGNLIVRSAEAELRKKRMTADVNKPDADDDPRRQDWPPTHSEQAATGKGGHVYYLAPGSHTLVRATEGWDADSWPNGIVGTPDGKKLYVNKWAGDNMGGTRVFDIKADGTLSNMNKFVDMGGDGMSMDEQGYIYISNSLGVVVFDPEGNKIMTIDTGGGATSNVFAGKDEKTLFITGPVGNFNKNECAGC